MQYYVQLLLQPYIQFLLGAAYSIQQSLEGLHIWTSNYVTRDASGQIVGSYWSPTQAVALPFAGLLIYTVALVVLLAFAVRFAFGKFGAVLLLLLLRLQGFSRLQGGTRKFVGTLTPTTWERVIWEIQ